MLGPGRLQRHHPGGRAQRGAGVTAGRDPPVALPAGPVESLGGLEQPPASVAFHHGRGRRQGVPGRPGRVRGTIRIAAGVGGDPVGGFANDALGLPPHPLGLGGGERAAGSGRRRVRGVLVGGRGCRFRGRRLPAGSRLGQGQVGGELAAAEAHRLAGAVGHPVQGHRVAGDLVGMALAPPRPHRHPVAG